MTLITDPLLTTAPRRLALAGKRWALRFEAPPASEDPDGDACGLTVYRTLTLYIDPNQPVAELLDTVTHELQHAIAHAYGPFDEETEGVSIDEQAATMAGRGWSDLLISNPKLGPWLSRLARASRKEHP